MDDPPPNPITTEWVYFRYRDLHRRVRGLEGIDEKYNPAVLADRVTTLTDEVRSLRRSFYTFAFGAVGSAILFAFTVFALLGHKP